MNFKGNALVPTKKTYARLVVKEIASILDSFLKNLLTLDVYIHNFTE
jgi:hypothetical protein